MGNGNQTYTLWHGDGTTKQYVENFLRRRDVPVISIRQSPASDNTIIVTTGKPLAPEDRRDLKIRGYSVS